ncbi:MAG TPA: hypothetical protein VGQ52_02580 [Gemmatimonadaceae bacterium]|nr:hypothetical protein [Gemmatimonadaceae bacterium]
MIGGAQKLVIKAGFVKPADLVTLKELFRSVAAFPPGSRFDIHFRVIDAATSAVVLQSSCYEFTISL